MNNYFKPGPITNLSRPISHRILKPEKRRSRQFNLDFGKAYVSGNVIEGNERITEDNWDGGVQVEDDEMLPIADQITQKEQRSGLWPMSPEQRDSLIESRRQEVLESVRAERPYPHSYINIHSAQDAYDFVLHNCGATLPVRDEVDQRITKMVRTGTVTYAEGNGIITDIEQVGGYPEYSGEPVVDTDSDGMPDEWERENGLNPEDAADAATDMNQDGYTHIEDYLYGLSPTTLYAPWSAPKTYKDIFWNER